MTTPQQPSKIPSLDEIREITTNASMPIASVEAELKRTSEGVRDVLSAFRRELAKQAKDFRASSPVVEGRAADILVHHFGAQVMDESIRARFEGIERRIILAGA